MSSLRTADRRTAIAWATLAGAVLASAVACSTSAPPTPPPPETVLFVCERGAAKSVVAAALFDARARARGLPFRASSRGIHPDSALSANAVAGLRSDGLLVDARPPAAVSTEDVRAARLVVAIDPLPAAMIGEARVERWEGIPPISQGYAASRDEMQRRIDALLDRLAR